MSIDNETLLLLRKLVKLINKATSKPLKIPEGILEWDVIENKFYKIKKDISNNIDNLCNIEKQKKLLLKNTMLFAEGKPTNNILLWGARGTGKSSLVLATFNAVINIKKISLLEIKTNQIKYLNLIVRTLSKSNRKFILFCDDFSFSSSNEDFILFKNILDGSAGKNKNILFYVTSNYRNLIKESRLATDDTLLRKQEKIDDEAALSDRFGLWLGFEKFDEIKYLKVVMKYCELYHIDINKNTIKEKAIQWSLSRGARSGREALNFVRSLFICELY